MNQKEVIESLRKEAPKNPALDAMLHEFAMRQRSRASLSLAVLARRMGRQGFKFTRAEYENAFRMLAKLGVGRLDTGVSGKVRALKDIKITFQSLGTAVYGNGLVLKTLKRKAKYVKIQAQPPKPSVSNDIPVSSITLTIPVPPNFEMRRFIKSLQS